MIDSDAPVTLWIRKCRSGNRNAFEELFLAYLAQLVVFCKQKLRNCPGSYSDEDLASDTMVSIWEEMTLCKTTYINDRDELWFAMMRVAKSKSIDIRRRHSRFQRFVKLFVLKGGTQPKTPFELDLAPLRKALKNTKALQILELKLEGHKTEEICSRLQLSERTFHRKSKFIRDVWEALQLNADK